MMLGSGNHDTVVFSQILLLPFRDAQAASCQARRVSRSRRVVAVPRLVTVAGPWLLAVLPKYSVLRDVVVCFVTLCQRAPKCFMTLCRRGLQDSSGSARRRS